MAPNTPFSLSSNRQVAQPPVSGANWYSRRNPGEYTVGGMDSGDGTSSIFANTLRGTGPGLSDYATKNLGYTGASTHAFNNDTGEWNPMPAGQQQFDDWMQQTGYSPAVTGSANNEGDQQGGWIGADNNVIPGSEWRNGMADKQFWTGAQLAAGIVSGGAATAAGAGSVGAGAAAGAAGGFTKDGTLRSAALGAGLGAAGGAVSNALPSSTPQSGMDLAADGGANASWYNNLPNQAAEELTTQVGNQALAPAPYNPNEFSGVTNATGAPRASTGLGSADVTLPSAGDQLSPMTPPSTDVPFNLSSAGQAPLGSSVPLNTSLPAMSGGESWLGGVGSAFANSAGNMIGQAGPSILTGAALQALNGKPPSAPDAGTTTAAQSQANLQAALTSNSLNRVNTTTPYGSQTFNTVADPSAPGGYRATQDIKLSPEQQQLYNNETSNQISKSNIATGLQGNVANAVKDPFALSNFDQLGKVTAGADAFSADRDKVTSALYSRLTSLRKPQMDRDRLALDTQLKNQGLQPGTAAYDTAMKNMMDSQGTELSNMADQATQAGGAEQSRLQGLNVQNTGFNNNTQQTAIQQALLARQQPLTELNSLQSGAAPTLPTFQPFGLSTMQPVNSIQAGQNAYQGQLNSYNAKTGNLQSLLNLFGTLNKTPSATGP